MKKKAATRKKQTPLAVDYGRFIEGIGGLLEDARRMSVRAVNAVMTATYWEIGRRVVEFEQGGAIRAEYGEGLLKRMAEDLTRLYGRGFSVQNLENMRLFYSDYRPAAISQTVSGKSHDNPTSPISQTVSRKSNSAAASAGVIGILDLAAEIAAARRRLEAGK